MAGMVYALTDGEITLSPLELTDAELVVAWDTDRDIQRWLDWPLTPGSEDPSYDEAVYYLRRP